MTVPASIQINQAYPVDVRYIVGTKEELLGITYIYETDE
jgi:hypothetical protein